MKQSYFCSTGRQDRLFLRCLFSLGLSRWAWRFGHAPYEHFKPLGSSGTEASVFGKSRKRFLSRFGFLHFLRFCNFTLLRGIPMKNTICSHISSKPEGLCPPPTENSGLIGNINNHYDALRYPFLRLVFHIVEGIQGNRLRTRKAANCVFFWRYLYRLDLRKLAKWHSRTWCYRIPVSFYQPLPLFDIVDRKNTFVRQTERSIECKVRL